MSHNRSYKTTQLERDFRQLKPESCHDANFRDRVGIMITLGFQWLVLFPPNFTTITQYEIITNNQKYQTPKIPMSRF